MTYFITPLPKNTGKSMCTYTKLGVVLIKTQNSVIEQCLSIAKCLTYDNTQSQM